MIFFKKLILPVLLSVVALSAVADGTLLIKVHYQGEQYDVVSVKRIPQTFNSFQSSSEASDDVMFRFSDNLDTTLAEGRVKNPRQVHPVLFDGLNVDQDHTHENQNASEGIFMLRYPYKEGLRFLQLMDVKQDNTPSFRSAPAVKIDLDSYLKGSNNP